MTNEKSDDDLGFKTSVGVENGNVLLIFSEKTNMVGYPPAAARKLAKALKKHAIEAENMTRKSGT
jgi:hypothetical protein